MSEKITIIPDSTKKFFYGYPSNVAIVGVRTNNEQSFMPVAWNVGLSYSPPLYGISVGLTRYTHKLLKNSNSFTVNFVENRYVSVVRSLGRSTGSEIDKIKEFNIKVSESQEIDAPILDIAYCTFECIKKRQILLGDHTLFVGEVVLIKIDKNAIGIYNTLNTEKISPLVYLGIDNYITLDKSSRTSLKELPMHYKENRPR